MKITNVIDQADLPKMIELEFIEKILDIYENRYRFINTAEICGIETVFSIAVDKYPYTKKPIFDYVTAPSISLVLGQACYVYVADLIARKRIKQTIDIDLKKYLELRDKGKLVFTKIEYNFSKKINSMEPFLLMLRIRSIKRLRSLIIAKFEYSVPDCMSGSMSLVADLGS